MASMVWPTVLVVVPTVGRTLMRHCAGPTGGRPTTLTAPTATSMIRTSVHIRTMFMADATSDNDVIKVLASSREAIRRWTDLLDGFYVTDASHHASDVKTVKQIRPTPDRFPA